MKSSSSRQWRRAEPPAAPDFFPSAVRHCPAAEVGGICPVDNTCCRTVGGGSACLPADLGARVATCCDDDTAAAQPMMTGCGQPCIAMSSGSLHHFRSVGAGFAALSSLPEPILRRLFQSLGLFVVGLFRAASNARPALFRRFVTARRVIYLEGRQDRCNVSLSSEGDTADGERRDTPWCESHGLETTCADQLQGSNRWERNARYMEMLQQVTNRTAVEACGGYHRRVVVPGVGHDHSLMFASPQGLRALFGMDDDATVEQRGRFEG